MSLISVSRASLLWRIVCANSCCSASKLGIQEQPAHADDGVHRRADLVAHIGQESALGLIGRLGLAACLLRLDVQGASLLVGSLFLPEEVIQFREDGDTDAADVEDIERVRDSWGDWRRRHETTQHQATDDKQA